MLNIHTTESFSRSGNSVVHCQQLNNLTGNSSQDKRKVLRNVNWYPQGLLGERWEKDMCRRSSGEGQSIADHLSVQLARWSASVWSIGLPGGRGTEARRAGVVALKASFPSGQLHDLLLQSPTPTPIKSCFSLMHLVKEQKKPEEVEGSRRRICSSC